VSFSLPFCENLITALFVVIAVPTAYLTQLLLTSVGIGEQLAFALAFSVLVLVGIVFPQQFTARFQ
jgi:hypothetical protein